MYTMQEMYDVVASLDFVLETAEQTAEREAKETIAKAAVRQPSELALAP